MTASLARRGALALALGTALLTGCTDHPDQTGQLEARAIAEEGLTYALPVVINAAVTSGAIDKPGTPVYRQPLHHRLTVQQVTPGASTADPAARPAADTLTAAQRQGLLQAYVTANLEFTLLHELSHAIFDEFDVPIFGHEEDAADTLATILMIRRHDIDVSTHESIRLLAVSEEWRLSWDVDQKTVNLPYWDAHALAIQRYYNVNACSQAPTRPRWISFSAVPSYPSTGAFTARGSSSKPSSLRSGC